MSPIISYKQQSRILNAIRFPLACMVVIIHCKINEDKWILPQYTTLTGEEFSTTIQILFSNILSAIAVPTFYLISGYFFFYRTAQFTKNIYLEKLKKRIHTLLIPYILWNVLYIFIIILMKIAAYFVKGKPLSNIIVFFEDNNWLHMFWDCKIWGTNKVNWLGYLTPSTGPILIPMWFIRDLIVLVLITPIIYFFIRKFKLWTIIVLGICYITGIWPNIHGFSITAVFFFSIGAYFSLYKRNMVNDLRLFRKHVFILYPLLTILMIYFNSDFTTIGAYIYPFYIIIGVATIINMTTLLEEKGKLTTNSKLSDTTFFIYAFHNLIALNIVSRILEIPFPTTDYNWINISLNYILRPFLTITICLISYYIMKKYVPNILNILTGSRS